MNRVYIFIKSCLRIIIAKSKMEGESKVDENQPTAETKQEEGRLGEN